MAVRFANIAVLPLAALTLLLIAGAYAPAHIAASEAVTIVSGPHAGAVDEPLRFRAQTRVEEISGVYWEFGDGSSDRGLSAVKAFDAPGVYEVTVTVKDVHGQTFTARTTAAIAARAP